jgi:DNA repair protein RadC
MEITSSIKTWNLDDRPREKFIEKGASNLSNAELLAILLGSGSKDESAVDLAKRILNYTQNNLSELGRLGIEDLTQFKGVGEAKAVTLCSAFEIARRKKDEVVEKVKITSANDVYNEISPYVSHLKHEEFWVLYLNRANVVLRKEKISFGGVAGTIVDNKIILKKALLNLASSIILVHNHPSGNLNPSIQDKKVTQKMKSACELLEINLLDHLIIAGNSYYSFADELEL